jgi:type VI secretion system protein ImpF
MSELTPVERIQPCLLDRLTDDDPKNPQESRNTRVISLQRYKRGVLRDLEWLFNSNAHLPIEPYSALLKASQSAIDDDGSLPNGLHSRTGSKPLKLKNFPLAARSVLNYGSRQFCGMISPDLEELERQLTDAIQIFEPRINPHTLRVTASVERHLVLFEIKGELWANPVPEQLFIKTRLDLETGQCAFGDNANG